MRIGCLLPQTTSQSATDGRRGDWLDSTWWKWCNRTGVDFAKHVRTIVGAFTSAKQEVGVPKKRKIVVGDRQQTLHLRNPAILHRFRSEEHTSELQSLMRIAYAVFCLQTKKNNYDNQKQIP